MTVTAPAIAQAPHAELISRAAAGDAAAFEQLVAPRADRAFRTARAILGNDSDAHDATQDAFVNAWRSLPRLRSPEQFDAWIRQILMNSCREMLRTRKRVREIPLAPEFDASAPGPATAEHVSDSDLLSRAFDRLDASKRSILVLHYLEHEPLGSIAAALGVPVGTLKWRLSEARAALQRALVAEGEVRR